MRYFQALICAFIGLILFAIALAGLSTNLGILNHWPEIEATLVKRSLSMESPEDYKVRLEVSYQIDGKDYRSLALASITQEWYESKAQDLIARARPGKPLSLRYDPADPKRLDVTTGWNLNSFGMLLGSLVGACFFWLLVPALWRDDTKDDKQDDKQDEEPDGSPASVMKKVYQTMLMLCLGLLMGLFGIFACYLGSGQLLGEAHRQSWPKTQAKVIASRPSHMRVSQGKIHVTRYVGLADVSYTVGGEQYLAPVRFGFSSRESDIAHVLAERYKPGHKASVIYNPDNPWQIYTPGNNEPADGLVSVFVCVFGGVLVMGALIIIGLSAFFGLDCFKSLRAARAASR